MSSFSPSKFRSIEVVTGPALVPTIGWTVLAVFFQTVFAQVIIVHGVVPSLVTIAVVLYAAKAGARRGAILGIIAGLLEDCFAGTAGDWTMATTLMALAVGGIARTFFSDGFAMLGALVALAVLLRDGIFWIMMSLQGYPRGFAMSHLHAAVWQALLTGAAAVIYLAARSRFVADRTAVERYP